VYNFLARDSSALCCNALGAVKKSELTEAAVFPLTPGPSPRWGEGKVY